MNDHERYILTKKKSQRLLEEACSNKDILKKIQELIRQWPFSSFTDIQHIRQDLKNILSEIKKQYFYGGDDIQVVCAIHCIVFSSISDSLISIVREKYKEEDLIFYNKCRELSEYSVRKGTRDEFSVLPYTAAIVELSLLDTHESPLEKLNCLCTSFDMVYAEIKLHLISIISKYSEKENEIPVLENNEILPVLEIVIVKSKLLYFCSNLFLVEYFCENLLQNNACAKNIFNIYRQAYRRIHQLNLKLYIHNPKKNSSLSITEAMEALTDVELGNEKESSSYSSEYKRQYSAQILKSTEANFVP